MSKFIVVGNTFYNASQIQKIVFAKEELKLSLYLQGGKGAISHTYENEGQYDRVFREVLQKLDTLII